MGGTRTWDGPGGAGADEGARLLALYDWQNDAFGGPPFVPQPAAAEFLMALGLRTGTPSALKAALRSLAVLPKSELADPVDGGFFERCEGARWKRPVTKKTLAVNAGLLRAFSTAAAWTGEAPLRRAAEETAAFIERHLRAHEGDLWARSQGPDDEYFEKMGHARAKREAPVREGTAGPAESAAAVSAFVRAGVCLDEPKWIGRARLAGRTLAKMELPRDADTLLAFAEAALDLEAATGDAEWGYIAGVSASGAAGPAGTAASMPAVTAARLRAALARSNRPEDEAREDVLQPPARGSGASPSDVESMAALGMAELLAAAFGSGVLCEGAPASAPGSHTARAAIGAAAAVGFPRVKHESGEGGVPASSTVRFFIPGRETAPIGDPGKVKEFLRGVTTIQEAI